MADCRFAPASYVWKPLISADCERGTESAPASNFRSEVAFAKKELTNTIGSNSIVVVCFVPVPIEGPLVLAFSVVRLILKKKGAEPGTRGPKSLLFLHLGFKSGPHSR